MHAVNGEVSQMLGGKVFDRDVTLVGCKKNLMNVLGHGIRTARLNNDCPGRGRIPLGRADLLYFSAIQHVNDGGLVNPLTQHQDFCREAKAGFDRHEGWRSSPFLARTGELDAKWRLGGIPPDDKGIQLAPRVIAEGTKG